MIYAVTGVHVIVCLFLIIVVLLQSGKAADLAGAFGGMGSQTVFGPRGAATVLSKATTIAAVLFMVTSLALAIIGSKQAPSSGNLIEKYGRKPVATQPQTPPPATPAPAPAAPAQNAPVTTTAPGASVSTAPPAAPATKPTTAPKK